MEWLVTLVKTPPRDDWGLSSGKERGIFIRKAPIRLKGACHYKHPIRWKQAFLVKTAITGKQSLSGGKMYFS
jgi:hypothetical protein